MSEHNNDLQQRFADAAMELLMDQYAQEEGNRLLECYREQAKEDTLPAEMDLHFQNLIRKTNQHMLIGSTLKRAARSAACVLIALVFTFQLAMTVEAFRIPVLNFMLKQGKGFTEISFSRSSSSFSAMDRLRILIWAAVPDGYQLSHENVNTDTYLGTETVTSLFVRFQNDQDSVLEFSVWKASGTTNFDSENATVTPMELYGQQTVFAAKEGELRAIWVNEEQGQLYSVIGYDTDSDTFWKCVHTFSEATSEAEDNLSF